MPDTENKIKSRTKLISGINIINTHFFDKRRSFNLLIEKEKIYK